MKRRIILVANDGSCVTIQTNDIENSIFSKTCEFYMRQYNSLSVQDNELTVEAIGNIFKFTYKSDTERANLVNAIFQDFIIEQYNEIHPNGKEIVDVGANNGTTSIYFASRGSTKVYALEPDKNLYNQLCQNVELNNLKNTIFPINIAYPPDFVPDLDLDLATQVKRFSPKQSLVKYIEKQLDVHIGNNLALKMDCEGCEYFLLNAHESDLNYFSEIIVEYHYGYSELLDKFRSLGFVVTILSGPFYSNHLANYDFRTSSQKEPMYYGILYAKRKDSAT
jgi:FkbM family methyltransferase